MRGLKRIPWLSSLGALTFLAMFGNGVRADVTTDKAGSILVFPKVVASGTRDTLIQIVNTDTKTAQVHCFYVNAAGSCNGTPSASCQLDSECQAITQNPNDRCERQCTPTNFDLFLTAGQPTVWRVSTGRLSNPGDPKCTLNQQGPCSCVPGSGAASGSQSCPGFDPGLASQNSTGVPPVVPGFAGELKCVSVGGDFQTPIGSDKLIGTAVLEDLTSGQISEYNALAIQAGSTGPNANNDLALDNAEYSRCPQSQILTHWADGVVDPQTGATITTELTLVPCTELLEADPTGEGTRSRALFQVVDEFEQIAGSADITFDCSVSRQLGQINTVFTSGNISSLLAKTRIRTPSGTICLTGDNRGLSCSVANDAQDCPNAALSSDGTRLGCRSWTGLLGVAEEFYAIGGAPTGTAAVNLHVEDGRSTNDLIDLGL